MNLLTYANAVLGGSLIGIAIIMMMKFFGRVCGVSGMIFGLRYPSSPNFKTNLLFFIGLILGCFIASTYIIPLETIVIDSPLNQVILAGLLVGVGTRLSNGCTSGHGICGIALFLHAH